MASQLLYGIVFGVALHVVSLLLLGSTVTVFCQKSYSLIEIQPLRPGDLYGNELKTVFVFIEIYLVSSL